MRIKIHRKRRKWSRTMEKEIRRERANFFSHPSRTLFTLLSALRQKHLAFDGTVGILREWLTEDNKAARAAFNWSVLVLRNPHDIWAKKLGDSVFRASAEYQFRENPESALRSLREMVERKYYGEKVVSSAVGKWLVRNRNLVGRVSTWADLQTRAGEEDDCSFAMLISAECKSADPKLFY